MEKELELNELTVIPTLTLADNLKSLYSHIEDINIWWNAIVTPNTYHILPDQNLIEIAEFECRVGKGKYEKVMIFIFGNKRIGYIDSIPDMQPSNGGEYNPTKRTSNVTWDSVKILTAPGVIIE